jgi:hypothetical protein
VLRSGCCLDTDLRKRYLVFEVLNLWEVSTAGSHKLFTILFNCCVRRKPWTWSRTLNRMQTTKFESFPAVPSSDFCPRNCIVLYCHCIALPASTLRLWVRISPRHGCLCVFCVRFFCFYVVSSETASRPKRRLIRTYHWISLFMSYIKSAN